MKPHTQELLRGLPSLSTLLEKEEVRQWLEGLPRVAIVTSLQTVIDRSRQAILAGEVTEPIDSEVILADAEAELMRRSIPSLRRTVNATGIVLHTGLGRAPLCDAAVEAIVEGVSGYCNLEYDLETGKRGRRNDHVVELLLTITGAPAATIVNNNAAATLLILQTFAAEREVVVSRGQLVEIGGSFRLPHIMTASRATLKEVGTTNRTRIADYERAITDRTAMLLRVHPSNYRLVGFTEETSIREIVELAHRYHLLAVDDLGSGALYDPALWGLPDEPCARGCLAAGADLICFSGDKLLGGPQCGIILGRQDLVDKLNRNPLMRTYRVGKMTLLALEATLRAYQDREEALASIPTLAMIHASTQELALRAQTLAEQLQRALPGEKFFVGSDISYVGGGSMPAKELSTVVVQWKPQPVTVDTMACLLREAEVPVIVRIRDDSICFDLRTIRESDMEALVSSVASAVWEEREKDAAGSDDISLSIL